MADDTTEKPEEEQQPPEGVSVYDLGEALRWKWIMENGPLKGLLGEQKAIKERMADRDKVMKETFAQTKIPTLPDQVARVKTNELLGEITEQLKDERKHQELSGKIAGKRWKITTCLAGCAFLVALASAVTAVGVVMGWWSAPLRPSPPVTDPLSKSQPEVKVSEPKTEAKQEPKAQTQPPTIKGKNDKKRAGG